MSTRNIIKADMHKLMPSYTNPFPADLIALAETYVTQTQNLHFTASDMPARLFLCSHLACDRLSAKHALPDLNTSAAPIPAAKYKSLFKRIKSEAIFKQVKDSGHNTLETTRRIARDQISELYTKLNPTVPLAALFGVLDRVMPTRGGGSDTRALSAAIVVLATGPAAAARPRRSGKASSTSTTTTTTELKDDRSSSEVGTRMLSKVAAEMGVTRLEVERAVEGVLAKGFTTAWIVLPTAAGARGGLREKLEPAARRKQRITQVRMMQPAFDFANDRNKDEFRAWKRLAVQRLDEAIDKLSSTRTEDAHSL